MILADLPELVALGNLAGVAPSKIAGAFNDAEHFFDHLTLDELQRLQGACERLGALSEALAASVQSYIDQARLVAAGAAVAAEVKETLNAN